MKKLIFLGLLVGVFVTPRVTYAQENQELEVEQSAEVFLEEYSDTFQENFFEGLKQMGIRNYDRAITYFLECKRLQPQNTVVTFELAKFHLYDKQFILAQEYALEALNGEPENYWYAETLVNVVDARKSVLEDVKAELPWSNVELRGNLAEIYFLNEDYLTAKSVLKGIKTSKKQKYLEQKINDSIAKQEIIPVAVADVKRTESSEDLNSVAGYKSKIEGMLSSASDNDVLLETTEEAMERFPSQPYFYYANGAALNKALKHKDAIDILETALDYIIDDATLENAVYKELANAYTATNNTSKANMYLSKIKSGF
ncbi:tetratricopeptide repeat protein [Maribacter sp. Asnod2-G09]|uniref:tetratricopeptide repeat protein n=1 Tax=Maribacter sp. Asnod2-G09 TaxID=3160577 RepID=UPI00386F9973